MKSFTMIVLTNAKPGRDAELAAWVDAVHLKEMLQLPGITSAQRLSLANPAVGSAQWAHAALYTVEAEDPAPLFDEMMRRYIAGEMTQCDALHEVSYNGIFAPEAALRDA